MNFFNCAKKSLLPVACLFLLSGCGAPPAPVEDPGGVQDIQPGEKSVITPPSHQAAPTGIEERNL